MGHRNNVDPDRMPHYVTSEQGLHCFAYRIFYQKLTINEKYPTTLKMDFSNIDNNLESPFSLKGTATLIISMFYQKELYEP